MKVLISSKYSDGTNGLRLQIHSENGHVLLPALRLKELGNQNLSTRVLQSSTLKLGLITTSDALEEGTHMGPFPAGAWQ